MRFITLTLIAILISCPDKSAHGAGADDKSGAKTNVTAVALDIKKTSSTVDFEYSKSDDYRTYTPKDNKLFSKIVKNKLNIWESQNDDHAVKVVRKTTGNNPKYLAILLKSNKFVILYKTGKKKPWTDITSERQDIINKLKFLGENNTELKSSDYKVDLVKLLYTFIFNDNAKCKKIMLGDKDIWKHIDDSNFASIKEFSLDLIKNRLSVTSLKDETKEVGVPGLTGPTVDIKDTWGTSKIEYANFTNSKLFTAKGEHTICKIVNNKSDVWTCKDNDQAVKVLLTGINSKKKDVAILLKSGKLVVLHRDGKNNPWTDVTSSKHDVNKLKFYGDGDTELSPSNYKAGIGFVFSYIVNFNDGVDCKKVKFGDKEVWKSKDDTNYEKIKGFSLDLLSNNFFVMNHSEQSKKLEINLSTASAGQTGTGTGTTAASGGQSGTSPATGQTASGGQDGTGTGTTPGANTTPSTGQTGSEAAPTSTTTTPATDQSGTTPTPGSGTSQPATGATPTPTTGTGQTTTPASGATTTTTPGPGTGTSQPATGTTQSTPTPATPSGQTGTGTRSTPPTTTAGSTTTSGRRTRSSPST